MTFTMKKSPPPLAAPALAPAPVSAPPTLSQKFAEAHDAVAQLELRLAQALEAHDAQKLRADTAEAIIEALKREFDKIRQSQDEEMTTLRNHGDHWHHEALRYREGISALQGPLKRLLDAPAEYSAPVKSSAEVEGVMVVLEKQLTEGISDEQR